MAKLRVTALSDAACRSATPRDRIYYLSDRGRGSVTGLRLCVRPNGSRLWMLRYTLPKVGEDGKAMTDAAGKPVMRESTAGLGSYPEVSLEAARKKAQDARQLALEGQHPTVALRVRRMGVAEAEAQTFGFAADRWLQQGAKSGFARSTDGETRPWSAHHLERNSGLIGRFLLPTLKDIPLARITAAMVERPILEAYEKGTRESARRAAVIARQIMSYARAKRWVANNPLADILEHPDIPKPKVRNFAALKPAEVGAMLRALGSSGTEWVTRSAIVLMLFTGVRDFALRAARWGEVDLQAGLWTIPADRMKSRREFQTPLPPQAVSMLEGLAKLTDKGPDSFVFASRGKSGHLAENTLRLRLHGLGFKVTAHGFRSLLTDVLSEAGFPADAIERQLDHVEQNRVRAAYLRSDFLAQRRTMLAWFADWCEAQCNSTDVPALPGNVVAIRTAA